MKKSNEKDPQQKPPEPDRSPEWLPVQGLPEDCVKVLPEPDGPHLRYSAEAAEHQPRRCHSRHLMHPATATNVHTLVHRRTAKTTEEKVALGHCHGTDGV